MVLQQSRYMVVEVLDLKTKNKSFKVYEHPARYNPPIAVGIATRAEAEAKIVELIEQEQAEAKAELMAKAAAEKGE